ncbi:SCF ubiquitin ligase complex subunit cdc4 [Coemansia sp. RSA 988]|nr:SCF ubiquitin ligase complex subunit cdc4 [Coemansia sp. RSA 988]
MDFRFVNNQTGETPQEQHRQHLRRHLANAPLPSPMETIDTPSHVSTIERAGPPSGAVVTTTPTAGVGRGKAAFMPTEGTTAQQPPVLSAQTVTTTTVTTTTVTTFPPLKLPRVRRQKTMAPDMYPLAGAPAPPALERFAIDINGQNLYFSQHDMGSNQSGEDILASIAANTDHSAGDGAELGSAAGISFSGPEQLQRAMTPMYTQDDDVHSGAAADMGSAYLERFSYGRRLEGHEQTSRMALGDRRSSSPPSPGQPRGFGRAGCSRSPRIRGGRASDAGMDAADDRPGSPAGGAVSEDEGAAVLPLPSPLLSPRARPEAMETDAFAADTSTRTMLASRQQAMTADMAAVYDMPQLMETYDRLAEPMQAYLLFQLLRRTARPTLQFAAQAVAPVLHRDFLGELPVEVAHHVLRFMGTRELCRAACVSRTWQGVVDGDRTVWRARLADARYEAEPARVHPLCHTYFGLAQAEPPRAPTAGRPTQAELDVAQLAPRRSAPSERVVQAARHLLGDAPRGRFKEHFAQSYRLDRNWQTGRCRQFNFACDGGSVVTCVQLTDQYIVAGFDTKNIYVFDITTGATVRQLVGHDGGVWALAVVGSTVVSGSTDRTVRVWDLDTGRCTHVFAGHSSTVRCLQVLLPADVRTPAERARGAPVRYEPREPLVVTGSRDTTLRVWRLPSPTLDPPYAPRTTASARASAAAIPATPVPPADEDTSMAVDQGADEDEGADRALQGMFRRLAPQQGSEPQHVAEPEQGSEPRQGSEPQQPTDMPSTSRHSTHSSRANPYFLRALEGHGDSVRAVAGHGNIVVSGSYDCTIRVWDVTTGRCLHQLEGHTSKVYTIVLDPDQHAIFSGSMDGMIRVWNWDTGACLRILRGHLTLVGLLALRHGTLVSAGADTTLRIWDHPLRPTPAAGVMQQRPFSNIAGDVVPYVAQPVGAVNVLTNHALAAVAHQAAGNLQQLHLLQQLQLQQRANDQLQQQQLVAGSDADAADLVRTERFMLRQHTNAITCFQHDGSKIVSGADSTLKLWDVRSGLFVRDLLTNLTSVWQVRFDQRRCVAAVNRNDVTYFEVMDFS